MTSITERLADISYLAGLVLAVVILTPFFIIVWLARRIEGETSLTYEQEWVRRHIHKLRGDVND